MISIIIPTIRPHNIPELLKSIEENTSVVHEVIWEEDIEHVGAPRMVKKLVGKAKYDFIVFLGDDSLLEKDCIDNALKMALEHDLWLVGFNDYHGQKAVHWLADKKLLDHLENREFFFTGYIHNYCDDELRVQATKLGKYGWCQDARIVHNHPAFGSVPMDDSYKVQTDKKNWEHDELLFNQRNSE